MDNVRDFNLLRRNAHKSTNNNAEPLAHTSEAPQNGNKVLSLDAFRTRKNLTAERKTNIGEAFRGISPVGNATKQNSVGVETPSSNRHDDELAMRIERIKSSIQRINQLMAELRGISPHGSTK